MTTFTPITSTERLPSLDIIRGFAVLGILVMNIQSFSMPEAAYLNPTAWGDFTGLNRWVWQVSHTFANSKFIALFSMLFGAGFLIFFQRAEQKTDRPGRLYARRLFWLLLFGLLHSYLLWSGDVLFAYALCGSLLYPFRHLSPRTLWITGLIFLMISSLLVLFSGWSLQILSEAEALQWQQEWQPSTAQLNAEISAFTGDWKSLFWARAEQSIFMQTYGILYLMLWFGTGYMLIGMAVTKQGLFQDKPLKLSGWVPVVLILIGTSVITYGVWQNDQHQWSFQFSQFYGYLYNDLASILVALGYLYGSLWLIQHNKLRWLSSHLALVGRMALTNYLMQSVLCTFLFYQLGVFGQVVRWQQAMIVMVIWMIQIATSHWWLARFRYGPFEWIWRQLTYGKRFTLRR